MHYLYIFNRNTFTYILKQNSNYSTVLIYSTICFMHGTLHISKMYTQEKTVKKEVKFQYNC